MRSAPTAPKSKDPYIGKHVSSDIGVPFGCARGRLSTPQSSAFADDLVAQDDRHTNHFKQKEPHSQHPYADTAWFELKLTVALRAPRRQ